MLTLFCQKDDENFLGKKMHHEILIFGYISPPLLVKQEVREWEFLVVWDVSWWRWDRVDCDLLHIYLSNKQTTLLRLNLYSIHMFKWKYPLRRYGEEGGRFLFCSTLRMFMCGPKLDTLIWALTQFWSPPQLGLKLCFVFFISISLILSSRASPCRSGGLRQTATPQLPSDWRLPRLFLCCITFIFRERQREGLFSSLCVFCF